MLPWPWDTVAEAHTEARNTRLWADAPADDATLDVLLEAASDQVHRFAPAVGVDTVGDPLPVPPRYKLATIYQARELQAAAVRDGDVIGVGDYGLRARPLVDSVKQLLRPQRGRPGVG